MEDKKTRASSFRLLSLFRTHNWSLHQISRCGPRTPGLWFKRTRPSWDPLSCALVRNTLFFSRISRLCPCPTHQQTTMLLFNMIFPLADRTVHRKSSIGGFYVCGGGHDILKFDKNSTSSDSHFSLRFWNYSFVWGIKPPRGDGSACAWCLFWTHHWSLHQTSRCGSRPSGLCFPPWQIHSVFLQMRSVVPALCSFQRKVDWS